MEYVLVVAGKDKDFIPDLEVLEADVTVSGGLEQSVGLELDWLKLGVVLDVEGLLLAQSDGREQDLDSGDAPGPAAAQHADQDYDKWDDYGHD